MYEVSKTPEVKRWESFGSCLEIEAEAVKVTREKVLQFSFFFFPPNHICVPSCSDGILNFYMICIFSLGSSSRECARSLGPRSVFPTAPLQTSRKATSYALPTKTAGSASSRFKATEGFRRLPACRRAAVRHSGTSADFAPGTELSPQENKSVYFLQRPVSLLNYLSSCTQTMLLDPISSV